MPLALVLIPLWLALLPAGLAGAAEAPNLLVNGGFEQPAGEGKAGDSPIPGWGG